MDISRLLYLAKKSTTLILVALALLIGFFVVSSHSVFAAAPPPPPAANNLPDTPGNSACTLKPGQSPSSCTLFSKYLFPAINFLGLGVGIIVTVMIVVGGIQYSSARGDANAVAQARKRITNAILGLLAFAALWTFLQWIVPGGILS